MKVAGLIIAGGAGERMSRSGATVPKPLVAVRGLTLLEWNLFALLKAGIRDLHVAVSARADTVVRFARSHCDKVAKALGATWSVIAEDPPLGSIGAAAFLEDRDAVLVVNADNLTSLDLRAIVAAHQMNGAALTLAVHDQAFPIPFGQVAMEGDRVVAYREKPALVVPICSAVSVLSEEALASLQPGEKIGLPAFTDRMLSRGADVRSFRHTAPWIDVNDLAAVERAEVLLAAHSKEFELWAGRPDRERVAVVFSSRRGVMLEQSEDGTWCFPTAGIGVDESPLPTMAHITEERFGVLAALPTPLAVFDDIDVVRGGVTRTRVFSIELGDGGRAGVARWVRPEEVGSHPQVAPVVVRSLAARAGHRVR